MIGWLVYAVGFIWTLVDARDTGAESPSNPLYFPYYAALIGGPVVYVSGVFNAVLPGRAGAAVWVAVTLLSSAYLAPASWVAYVSGWNVTTIGSDVGAPYVQNWLMFEGVLFELLCWSVLLIFTIFYQNPSAVRQNINHSQDCLSAAAQRRAAGLSRQLPFVGVARALSVPFIILSAVSWCFFIVGFYKWNTQRADDTLVHVVVVNDFLDDHSRSMAIAVIIIAPVLFLTALLHAGCSGRASTMGVLTAVLHVAHVVSCGTITVHLILNLINNCKTNVDSCTTDINFGYMLGGSSACLIFWALAFSLLPFYGNFDGGYTRVPEQLPAQEAPNNVPNANAEPQERAAPSPPPPNYEEAQTMARPAQRVENERQPLLAHVDNA